MTFEQPQQFTEALDKLRRREVLPADLGTAEWRQVQVALRERAFFSAHVENARLLQTMRDYLEDYLAGARDPAHGGLKASGRAEFVADMRELAIAEGLGRVDPETGEVVAEIREDDLRDIRSLRRLQLIFDTQVEAAHEYGFWLQGQTEELLWVYPASRFIRVRPVMVPRDYHLAHEGEVHRKDDLAFWLDMNRDFGVPWGPWGFGSGMGTEDVDREEAEALGLLAPGEKVRSLASQYNQGLSASLAGLDGDLAELLRRLTGGTAAGGRLKAGGGAAEPVPTAPPAPPASTTVDEGLAISGIRRDADITEEQARALIEELKEAAPRPARPKIKSIKGAQRQGPLTKAWIERTMQEFVDFLPPDMVDILPEIDIKVRRSIPNERGNYARDLRLLQLSARALQDDPVGRRRTFFHELLHWVHEHGPLDIERQVRALFLRRTSSEPVVRLAPHYLAWIVGKRDKWLDADGSEYAGRIYDWETTAPKGTEVVTQHLEKLADPALLARHWNHAHADGSHPWREAFVELLQIMYWRP